jgi:hypothetical protein
VNRLRHHDSAGDARGDGGEAGLGAIEEHRSPGLKAALAGAAARTGCRVLDLGPVVPANIAFLARFASHVSIADLSEDDGGGPGPLHWRERLAFAVGGSFDLVLVWDYLNRLDRREARDLVDRLRSVTRPGAVLFLVIHEGPEMPARPVTYEILGEETIRYRPADGGSVAAPTILPAEVGRMLAGFRVDASFLLRHGVREYVAVRAV